MAKISKAGPIFVSVPAKASNDFDSMTKITKEVLGKLGCPGCHSGFDLRFINERILVFNEKLDIVRGAGF